MGDSQYQPSVLVTSTLKEQDQHTAIIQVKMVAKFFFSV